MIGNGLPPGRVQDFPAVARRIERALEERDWSQRELARKSGLNASQVSNLLRRLKEGGGVSPATVGKIAAALGVSFQYVLFGVERSASDVAEAHRVSQGVAAIQQTELAGMGPVKIARRPGTERDANGEDSADSPLEMALFDAMDRKVFTARDFDAARGAVRESQPCAGLIDGLDEAQLLKFAKSLLTAARWLRTAGEEVLPIRVVFHANLVALRDDSVGASPE